MSSSSQSCLYLASLTTSPVSPFQYTTPFSHSIQGSRVYCPFKRATYSSQVSVTPISLFLILLFIPRRIILFKNDFLKSRVSEVKIIRDIQNGCLDVYVRKDRKSTRLNSSHVRISYAVF